MALASRQEMPLHHLNDVEYSAIGSNFKQRQLTRILVFLRDDLHAESPQLPKPTSQLLARLVEACPLSLLHGSTWQTTITDALGYLSEALRNAPHGQDTELVDNASTRLFPNADLFDRADALAFIEALQIRQHRELI